MTDFTEYHVVLLCEKPLCGQDATGVQALHDALEQPVIYHVLVPMEDAAARVEAAIGTMSGEMMPVLSDVDIDEVRRDCAARSEEDLKLTIDHLAADGAICLGEVVAGPPIDALIEAVKTYDAQEVIVLTRPHVVAEFLHLDWTSQARRKLGVPVLHLLEQGT